MDASQYFMFYELTISLVSTTIAHGWMFLTKPKHSDGSGSEGISFAVGEFLIKLFFTEVICTLGLAIIIFKYFTFLGLIFYPLFKSVTYFLLLTMPYY